MGIKNLMTIIKKHCKEDSWNNLIPLITVPKPANSSFSRVAVDTSLLLYKYRHASTVSKRDLHIIGFINRIVFYISSKMIPIFVFDGKPPTEKDGTIAERKNHKEKVELQIKELQDKIELETRDTERQELEKQLHAVQTSVVYVTKAHFEDIRTLLIHLGIPYFDPSENGVEGEAEHICSTLQKRGIVDHVVSDDTDTFVFGATSVLRSAPKGKVNHMFLGDILQGLQMTQQEFVDFCIISGCDYCGTVPKIGCAGAYSAIKKNKTIEEWLKVLPASTKETEACVSFVERYKKARQIFTNDYQDIPPDISATLGNFQETELTSFLLTRDWEIASINKVIKKYKNARSKLN